MQSFQYTRNNKSKGFNYTNLMYGTWGLQSITYGRLYDRHVKSIKAFLLKQSKKNKTFKLNINLNKVNTKKPIEIRMGGGKGNIVDTSCFIKPGAILVEIYNFSYTKSYDILKQLTYKLPLKLRIIKIK